MKAALRFRLALAWEEVRVPAGVLIMGLLLAGTYLHSVARAEAMLAMVLTPTLAAGLALRSLWNEASSSVRALAIALSVAAGGGALVAIWGPDAPWQSQVAIGLWACLPAALVVQIFAAYRGARSFFAIGIGIAVALGLFAPAHIDASERPGSVLAGLIVAFVAGGGGGVVAVALGDRFAPASTRDSDAAAAAKREEG
jgi:hypothetical protein